MNSSIVFMSQTYDINRLKTNLSYYNFITLLHQQGKQKILDLKFRQYYFRQLPSGIKTRMPEEFFSFIVQ